MIGKTYRTELEKDKCLSILSAHNMTVFDRLKFGFNPPELGTIFTKVDGDKFRIEAQGHRFVSNSFVPYFYGRFIASVNGTRFQGRIQMHPLVRVFLTIWFGLLGIFTVMFFLGILSGKSEGGSSSLLTILIPVFMMVLGVGLVKFGKLISRKQQRSIERFLDTELMAHKEEP